MDALAEMWARRRLAQLERAEMIRLVMDVRAGRRTLAPMIAERQRIIQMRMRQDGPSGFVMVPRAKP